MIKFLSTLVLLLRKKFQDLLSLYTVDCLTVTVRKTFLEISLE